jgi:hypothetical protein
LRPDRRSAAVRVVRSSHHRGTVPAPGRTRTDRRRSFVSPHEPTVYVSYPLGLCDVTSWESNRVTGVLRTESLDSVAGSAVHLTTADEQQAVSMTLN